MKIQQFLKHHHLAENPFSQEDATSDHVFRSHLIDATRHPAWDKVYGPPDSPATSIVFGEQGAGKTALRMQIVDAVRKYNSTAKDGRTFVLEYDDFNPFLDTLKERLPRKKQKPDRAVGEVRLSDHMDAILSLATTRLIESISGHRTGDETPLDPDRIAALTTNQRRDILLLTTAYDRSTDGSPIDRFRMVKSKLGYRNWFWLWDVALGVLWTTLTLFIAYQSVDDWREALVWWLPLVILVGWLPMIVRRTKLWWRAGKIARNVRVLDRPRVATKRMLARFKGKDLVSQPLPDSESTDPRYELIHKLQSILATLGYRNILVLVDRVDEPHLVNGNPERMRDLLWPMFDNKFLKMPDVAFKMLLPAAVTYYLDRQEQDFYQRSRLDKQNMVPSLERSGESLYDVTNDRLRACSEPGKTVETEDLFEESVTRAELIKDFGQLRVPRHLFKFLYRLMVEHCGKYTESDPRYRISRETMQSQLAVFRRDLDAYDRGTGTG